MPGARALAIAVWAELRARDVNIELPLVLAWVEDRAMLTGQFKELDPERVLEDIWTVDVVAPRMVDAVVHSLASGGVDGLNA